METNGRPSTRPEHAQQPCRLSPRQEAETLLRGSGYLVLREVTCVVRDGVAHLHGHLPTYYLKQVAQAMVAEAEGVRGVVNHIEVIAPSGRSPEGVGPFSTRAVEAY